VLSLAAGCVGQVTVGDPEVKVAELAMRANQTSALQLESCATEQSSGACSQYPNPAGCARLEIAVQGDGSTVGSCKISGQQDRILRGTAQGIPLGCRYHKESGCVQCVDLYGATVLDTCGSGAPAAGPSQSGTGGESTSPPPPSSPPGASTDPCDPVNARLKFAEEFNNLLAQQGLPFSYQPDLSKPPEASSWFDNEEDFQSQAGQSCETWGGEAPLPGTTTNQLCFLGSPASTDHQVQGQGWQCQCGQLTHRARYSSCSAIPSGCDRGAWSAAFWFEEGAATMWLMSSDKHIQCKGSPLVLDLADDGIALTSPEEGVRFSLGGHGPVQTAWVKGNDDALLAIDLNGNGRIDGGGELFGDASRWGGLLVADGFQALAILDSPAYGGNGNGLVEENDLLFDQLLLWSDANHNGISEAGELRSLGHAGIGALEIRGKVQGRVTDASGNDLSLRGRYLRSDGSTGLMVDAFFVTRGDER
jgi:hypothetical protein